MARYFVQQEADGSWTPVYQDDSGTYYRIGSSGFATQGEAEQAAGAAQNASGATNNGYDWAGYNKSQAASKQAAFDEEKRQYDTTNTLYRDQLAENARQSNQSTAAGLASTALSKASDLGGQPKDWINYANYTNGVKNVFNTLYGDKAAQAFGVSGYSQPKTVQDIMKDLGLT